MNFFFIFIFSLLSSSISLEQSKSSLCINCKYFIPSSHTYIRSKTNGKCSLFPTIKYKQEYFLLNPNKKKVLVNDYRDCETARKYEFMCGKNGNLFLPPPC